jgi:threonine dehydrogenase-like Zn-dependent dehydrogenase
MKMLAAVVRSPGHLSVEEVPDPIIGNYDALVKIYACSFCNGTDSKLIEGRFPGVDRYPFILGHESVGKIVETGDRVRKYKKGDWVLRPSATYPKGFTGGISSFWGGFAEMGVVSDYSTQVKEKPGTLPLSGFSDMQQVIPGDVDPIKATLYVTFKETLSWLRKVGLKEGQSILIIGSGPVGLAFATCAKVLGAYPVIMVGRRDERLSLAFEFGVDYTIKVSKEKLAEMVKKFTNGRGVDLAIESVGDYSLINEALKTIAPGGKVGTYGIPPSDASTVIKLDTSNAPGDWTLRFTGPDEPSAHSEILTLIKHGRIRVDKFITHIYFLKEINEGYETIKRREALKVVIRML